MSDASRDLGEAAVASGVFGVFAESAEVWVHIVGLMAGTIGFYYLYAAWVRDLHFFRASMFGRFLFCAGMVSFYLLGKGGAALVGFGLVDLVSALWTAWTLRSAR
jgi:hypothetical protein